MKGKYLYGIIRKSKVQPSPPPSLKLRRTKRLWPAGKSPRRASLRGRQKSKVEDFDGLSTVGYQDLSCVVAEREFKDYQSLAKKEAIKELTNHQQVIEKIMDKFTVLPVKFGTMLKNDKEVKSVLEKGYFFLQDTLNKMQDKIELDLACFWSEEKAGKLAFKEDERVQKMQQDLTGKGTTTLEDKITLGKAVANYLAVKKTEVSSEILRVLKKEVVESCSHVLADVNMLLNQAFLIKKQNEERFNHTLNRSDSKFSDLVNFRLVGPLPPYSFATVVIDALNKEEIKKAKKLLGLSARGGSAFGRNGELNKKKIKKAYDKLVFKLHPDHEGDPIKFERVTRSYKLLRKYVTCGLIDVHLYQWEKR